MITIIYDNQTTVIKKNIKKFEVDIKNDDLIIKVIEKEPEEEVLTYEPEPEEIKQNIKMEIQEIPKEEPTEKEIIDLPKVKEILNNCCGTKNTADTYFRSIKHLSKLFPEQDIKDMLKNNTDAIIKYLELEYENYNSLITKLSAVLKIYRLLKLPEENINKYADKIEYYKQKREIKHDTEKEENKKTVEEGTEILNTIKLKKEELKEVIKEDIQLLNNWETEAQLYALLTIWEEYGILRPDEVRSLIITYDDDKQNNHINLTTKKIIFYNHKNKYSNGIKEIDISGNKKLVEILKKGEGKYLVTNSEYKKFCDTSGFSKLIKKYMGFAPYEIRKAKTSQVIRNGDIDEIKQLGEVQGHSLSTQLKHYNNFSKCLIED